MSNSSSSGEVRFEDLYRSLLRKVRDSGQKITSADTKDGKNPKWITKELSAQTFHLTNPRDRLIISPVRNINIYQAIGQLLWILTGSYHLNPIAYYTDTAKSFSTDKKIMIGAYGFRLFGPAHLNQMETILKNLTRNPTSRRAVASIYMPEFDREYDSTGRKLEDEIPCALNFQFLVRNDKLDMIVYMRSQNVLGLLPYDVFIFTMLQEYLATLLHKEVGVYFHFSGSFHIYEDRLAQINSIIDDKTTPCSPMPKMPIDEEPQLYVSKLIDLENELRTEVSKLERNPTGDGLEIDYFLEQSDKMPEYWKQLALMLMSYSSIKLKDHEKLGQISKKINAPLKLFVDRHMAEVES